MEDHRLQSNIQKIFWLNGTFAFMVLMPIIVPFFQSRGLDMKNIYELQAIFAGFMLVFEVPSGYFSDLFGRKRTLVLASALNSLGYLVMALSPDFTWLVVSEIILALSISLFSGTDLSLLYDSLEASGSGKAPIKMLGRQIFSRQMGEGVAGLIGGWLFLIHFEAPAIGQAFVGLFPMAIALSLYEPPREKMKLGKTKDNVSYICRSMFQQSRLLNLIIVMGIVYSFWVLDCRLGLSAFLERRRYSLGLLWLHLVCHQCGGGSGGSLCPQN
jgi:MFS family permease